jgi:hypothetical protein
MYIPLTTFAVILFALFNVVSIVNNGFTEDTYKAKGTNIYNHRIFVDDHFVFFSNGRASTLYYSEFPQKRESPGITYDKIFAQSAYLLNWTNEYIITSGQSEYSEDLYYMIIDRETLESLSFQSEEEFEVRKNELGIDIELKERTSFDWY